MARFSQQPNIYEKQNHEKEDSFFKANEPVEEDGEVQHAENPFQKVVIVMEICIGSESDSRESDKRN